MKDKPLNTCKLVKRLDQHVANVAREGVIRMHGQGHEVLLYRLVQLTHELQGLVHGAVDARLLGLQRQRPGGGGEG